MKVLIVNSEDGLRGGELQTLLLARGLKQIGCDVKLALKKNSRIYELAHSEFDCCGFLFESPPVLTPIMLASFCSKWKPDIVHAQTARAHSHALLARLMMLRKSTLLVVSKRTTFKVSGFLSARFKYRSGADHFVPISEAAADVLKSIGIDKDRITVIPSGIELDRFGRIRERRVLKKSSEKLTVGTIGSLEREKGHIFLVDAAKKVLSSSGGVRFIIYGKGKMEDSLKERIRMHRIGNEVEVITSEMPIEEVLSRFDIFVLPSVEEGLSTALLAAMASGLPVVASKTGGIPEVVEDGTALLVPPQDSDSLAEAILLLINDEELRHRMAEAAYIAVQRFDIRITVERTFNLYKELLRRRGIGQ